MHVGRLHLACVVPMRYLVLTDIHANLEALDACLADADSRGYDRTLVLGDLVGYGADPNAVIERVQRLHRTRSSAAITTRLRAGSSRPTGSIPSRAMRRAGRSNAD